MAWDGIDEVKAVLGGWRTAVLEDLRFMHHRRIGGRETSRFNAWQQDGAAAWYMGYRVAYLCMRGVYHVARDRDLAATGLILGYISSWARSRPRSVDDDVRLFLRRKQLIRHLPARAREVTARHDGHHVDLLLVADGGGHLLELTALEEVWSRFSRAWVTVAGVELDGIPNDDLVFFGVGPTQRSLISLAKNAFAAVRLLRVLRPSVILTTGAALAVPFVWLGRLMGAEIVYIECSGRVGISLSGRMVAPVANRFYVQWPEALKGAPRARYAGTTLLSRR